MRTIFIIAIKAKRRWRSQVGVALLSAVCFSSLAHAGTAQAEVPGATSPVTEAPAQPLPATAPAEPVIELPKLIHTVEAAYPEEAERAQLEANVRLRLRVDTQGQVTQAEVMEPVGHGFDEAARTAALQFRFTPAKRNGVPAPARVTYTYVFQLPGRSKAVAATPPPALSSAPKATASQDEAPTEYQEDVEVTAVGETRAERRRKSAEAVQVIELEQASMESADLGTALSRTEGVDVRRTGGLGSTARISIAGLSDDQVRFFVDGVPLELAGYGPGLANVPVNLVQQMEVYQGVVPIRFGADVLGGAVELVTDQDVRGSSVSGSYELASFDTHRFTASARHLQESTGLLVRAHGFYDDARNNYPINVEVPNDLGKLAPVEVRRFHDGYRAGGASVEAGFVDQPWARRLLVRGFINAAGRDIQNDVNMESPYGEVTTAEGSAGATLRFAQSYEPGVTVDAVGGYTFRRNRFLDIGTCAYDWYGRCFTTLPQPGEITEGGVERYVNQHTAFARLQAAWSPVPNGAHTLRLALAPTFVERSGEDRRLQANNQPDPLSVDRGVTSLVTGVEYQLDAFDGRLQNIAFVKDYLQDVRAQKLLPSSEFMDVGRTAHELGVGDSLRFRLTSELSAKASYEWATRLPRPDELFGDGLLIGDNMELRPEVSHNFNLGLGYASEPGRAGSFRANVAGFARLTDQLIVLIGQGSFFTYQNVYGSRSLGGLGGVGWTSPGRYLSLDGNATYQDLRNTSSEGNYASFDGQRIPNRPYLTANGSAQARVTDLLRFQDELLVTWRTRFVDDFLLSWEELGSEESKLRVDSQLTHSLAFTYVIRDAATRLSWTLDIQNLTNAQTFDFYGVQRPGRIVAAKFTLER
ncbi:TonB-dependent siderophore myxochelin receptor MxcH [Corallococcus aberystwythensis]|uniref:TonB family protein n=1 Tax=Corallococcus aberystwythensis TaxID=2316722 RepID=A0A3A8Q7H6_9BACT|nr:TonB-dependent siderophore myxochelin receptor MxcH [Corallococcus aberystwythensis]RKH62920.1 TonB family protein [Corallococcus aberystwythensis]